MRYAEYLKTLVGCPFCVLGNRVIRENGSAFLTYSLAPYSEHHLLVLPKRHVESFLDLVETETHDIDELIRVGVRLIESFGHADYSILVRNGDKTGKSVKHLHYHIIPGIQIGSLAHGGGERTLMTDAEADVIMEECRRRINLQ